MTKPDFFIYRNKNKYVTQAHLERIMKNLDWDGNSNTTDLANSDSLSLKNLEAMRLVARMKEVADKVGAGFVGGFISDTGERFMMSNIEADSDQLERVEKQIAEQHHSFLLEKQIQKMLEDFEGI